MHLEEIAFHVAPGANAVLLLDRAGWHGSDELVVPPNCQCCLKIPQKCRVKIPQFGFSVISRSSDGGAAPLVACHAAWAAAAV